METIRVAIDTSELKTVERMGVAVPVLLVVADLTAERCYFCCLNDYIDKILIPRYDDYTSKNTRTIHVPIANEIGEPVGLSALRWYAKRAKLYAAFQRFTYQAAELNYAWESSAFLPMARYFASRIVNYDFWDDTEMWPLIAYYGSKIRHFLETGQAALIRPDTSSSVSTMDDFSEEDFRLAEILELWRILAALPRNYEDVCREWFLPTALGYAASYPTHS